MKQLIAVLALAVAGLAEAGSATAASSDPANAPAQAGTPQRSKMKACNADAKTKGLHGDDRRAFMKQCLSAGKAKSAAN